MPSEIESRYAVAAGLERCALGWEEDAERYIGSRKTWRLARAQKLWDRCWSTLEF